MLRPYEMSSVILTGPIKLQERVINELHKLRILHIVEHTQSELADIGDPLENANALSEIIVKVRALITALDIKEKWAKFKLQRGLLEINQTTKKLNEELINLLDKLKETEEYLSKSEAVKQELEILKNIDIPLETFASYKSLAHFRGYLKQSNLMDLKGILPTITENFMLLYDTVEKKSFIALFVDVKHKENVSKILQGIGFSPVSFTNIETFKGTAAANFGKIEVENIKLRNIKDNLNKQIEELRTEYKGFLLAAEEFLSRELEKAEAPLKFAVTKDAFLIKGWVPTAQLNSTIDKLNKAAENKVFIHSEIPKKNDDVPVKLKNKKYAEPFEFFMDLYSMPTYKEIDPTFFVFLTFPLLFGFMLGDFGYGLVTLVLFIILKKAILKAKNLFNVLIVASLATMFFGLLFGEIFGYEEIFGFHLPHILSRSHQINELTYLAIAIVVVHVNFGLIIGFVNELRSHGIIQALNAKGGWIVLEIGAALLALSYFKIIILPIYVGAVFFIGSLYMIFKGEGIRGLIELPSIFSNILSYASLMAIGLSSVKLAEVINEYAAGMFHKGGFLILAGVLILVVGHAVNIGLGMLGSFLHSLRLHYVEFFTKFFHGGAKRYSPFGARE